jgi:hypothetical protein
MQPFWHDYESTELTVDEVSSFGMLAKSLWYPDLQNQMSEWFATITRPQPDSVCDYACRQVERGWRVESRM